MNSGTFRWVVFAGVGLVVFVVSLAIGFGIVALLRTPGDFADESTTQAPEVASNNALPSPTLSQRPQLPAATPVVAPTEATSSIDEQTSAVMLLADDNMFCRAGPGVEYEQEWTVNIGVTVPIVGNYANNWHLVEIDDPRTRTECCWVGGGVVQGDASSIPTISSLPPGGFCP